MNVLQVENLCASYGRIQVIRNVSLMVGKAEVLILLGPNGAGKSSTLGAMAGLVASTGAVEVEGQALGSLPAHRRARMGVSLVPEGRKNLFGALSVGQNLAMGLRLLVPNGREKKLQQLQQMFPIIKARWSEPASMLSGGEQQLVAIAVAVAKNPAVLLLDEPSQGLSPVALDGLVEAIARLRDGGMSVVLAEQNVKFAERIGDRYAAIGNGALSATGAVADLAQQHVMAALMLN